MATRPETQEIASAFQRYNKSNDRNEIENYTLPELIRADEDLGWRDKNSNFRLALQRRIRELEEDRNGEANIKPLHSVPSWVVILGAAFGGLTLLFLMTLVVMSTLGYEIPCNSRFLIVAVLAFGASLSSSFLGGSAAAKGVIPLPYVQSHPLQFSVAGGIAVLMIILFGGKILFAEDDCRRGPTIACAEEFQSFYAPELRLGFCYPRGGWELDKGPIEVNAADIYVRSSKNKDISIHFHVSLIPTTYSAKHKEYMTATANTWRQLDQNLELSEDYLSGRPAYSFNLHVKDRVGRSRPTQVTSVFLSSEKLLEVITTWFDNSPTSDVDALRRIRSSVVIEK